MPVVERWTPERWTVAVAGQTVRDGANPYGWIPYVTLPNDPRPHAFWGQSDLADLYDVCRDLNTRLSTVSCQRGSCPRYKKGHMGEVVDGDGPAIAPPAGDSGWSDYGDAEQVQDFPPCLR